MIYGLSGVKYIYLVIGLAFHSRNTRLFSSLYPTRVRMKHGKTDCLQGRDLSSDDNHIPTDIISADLKIPQTHETNRIP